MICDYDNRTANCKSAICDFSSPFERAFFSFSICSKGISLDLITCELSGFCFFALFLVLTFWFPVCPATQRSRLLLTEEERRVGEKKNQKCAFFFFFFFFFLFFFFFFFFF